MNTLILKSILFFALGVFSVGNVSSKTSEKLTFLLTESEASNFSSINEKDCGDGNYTEFRSNSKIMCIIPPDTTCSSTSKIVPIDEAELMVAELQLWQRMVPLEISIINDSIHYTPRSIDSSDLSVVKVLALAYNDKYIRENPSSPREMNDLSDLPFSTTNDMAQSYFIPFDDLNNLINDLKRSNDTICGGARVYMAAENLNFSDPDKDSVSSHLLLTAAKSILADLDPNASLYDLTRPCPNTCPSNSRLNSVSTNVMFARMIEEKLKKIPVGEFENFSEFICEEIVNFLPPDIFSIVPEATIKKVLEEILKDKFR